MVSTTRSQRSTSSSLTAKRTLSDDDGPRRESKKSKSKRNLSTNIKKRKPATMKGGSKEAITAATSAVVSPTAANNMKKEPLLTLETDMVSGTLVSRPSKRNRSPYVADLLLRNERDSSEREAIVHVPNLDMGGKCVPGATLLVKPARDRKGNLVGPDAVSPKYGTPKCEFIAQLLRVDETALGYSPPVWVGAHPTLGEKIAEQLIQNNALHPHLPKVKSFQREVRNVCGADMRADFLIEFEQEAARQHKPCVLEVKTVVDTDFAAGRVPGDSRKCVFVSEKEPYRRAGIFPWGSGNQKGPEGEKVVSARAIKHLCELTRIAQGKLKETSTGETYQAAVLFVVIRSDATYFRPNHDACPSFCRYLKEAKDAGVTVLAKRVDWGDTAETIGQCFEGPLLDIELPGI